ncbi:hypothetical protein BCD67_18270 [Oscillatoriales cyanobacterium USR001]|nr:hypothetical protein BCD67_18270 [Oscillatoriales cyanobacterium USR001]
MQTETISSECAIAEIFCQVCKSGKLTRTNRHSLMFALLDYTLTEEDRSAIDRLIHATRRGWVTILD